MTLTAIYINKRETPKTCLINHKGFISHPLALEVDTRMHAYSHHGQK